MAKIYAVLTKGGDESIAAFKERCGAILFKIVPEPGAFAVGRFTLTPHGLENPMAWGQGWLNELPSETCVIASYDRLSARNTLHTYDSSDLASAPRNPVL